MQFSPENHLCHNFGPSDKKKWPELFSCIKPILIDTFLPLFSPGGDINDFFWMQKKKNNFSRIEF